MSDERSPDEREERAWRALRFMQMRLDDVIADAAEAVPTHIESRDAAA